MLESDAGAAPNQRRRVGMIAQVVRDQQHRQRFRQSRNMLRNVDQRHGKIARSMQDRNGKRANQHDVAGRGRVLLPKHDRPGEQAERQHDRHDGVKDAQLLKVEQAASPRLHFAVDGGVKTAMLAE